MPNKTADLPRLVSISDLARAWNIGEATARRWARDAQIPAVKIGRDWRFDVSALRRVVDDATKAAR